MVLIKGHGTDADKEFREALRNRLKELPFPKYRIAMELGISQGQLSGILNNTTSASLGAMEKIAKSLGSTVADMLMEGRRLCGEAPDQEKLNPIQAEALKAFEDCLLAGGEAADMLARNAIELARRKKASEIPPPSATVISKSA